MFPHSYPPIGHLFRQEWEKQGRLSPFSFCIGHQLDIEAKRRLAERDRLESSTHCLVGV